MQLVVKSGVIKLLLAEPDVILTRPSAERTPGPRMARAATVAENIQVVNKCNGNCRWFGTAVAHPCVDVATMAMT
jgi:hypothetical protein